MSSQRENLLLSGGVLIGFGAGLCVGVGLLFVSVALIVPLIVVAAGGLLLRWARRVEA
jgi:hypothetical protein